MHAFSPGTSPPPVRMPILIATGYGPARARRSRCRLSCPHVRRPGPAAPRVARGDLPGTPAHARGARGGVRAVRDRAAVPEPRSPAPPLAGDDLGTGLALQCLAGLFEVGDDGAAVAALDEPDRRLDLRAHRARPELTGLQQAF